MKDPDVILLDEPFNAIDIENLTQIYNLLNGLREKGKMIIIASHGQVNFSELAIDAEIVMADGRIEK
jgi:ABC-2 type transport system ATP-binding protein